MILMKEELILCLHINLVMELMIMIYYQESWFQFDLLFRYLNNILNFYNKFSYFFNQIH